MYMYIYTCTFSGILTLVCSTNIKPQDLDYKEKKVYELLMPYNHSWKESVNYEGGKTISKWNKFLGQTGRSHCFKHDVMRVNGVPYSILKKVARKERTDAHSPLPLFTELVFTPVPPQGIRTNHIAGLSQTLWASFVLAEPLPKSYVLAGSTPLTRTCLSHSIYWYNCLFC